MIRPVFPVASSCSWARRRPRPVGDRAHRHDPPPGETGQLGEHEVERMRCDRLAALAQCSGDPEVLVLHRGLPDPNRDYEREASHFAGALLMPRADAVAAFSSDPPFTLRRLAELKSMWGISIAGLVMRARQVEAIDTARVESLYKQISARGWRTSEPVTVHRESPALLPRLLEANFGKPVDWKRAARQFGIPPHLLRELACVAQRDLDDGRPVEPVELRARRRQALGLKAQR